jgi:hypothetical protein
MDDKKINLTEQEAPLKNTDQAFVQVSKDDNPAAPQDREEKPKEAPAPGLKNR